MVQTKPLSETRYFTTNEWAERWGYLTTDPVRRSVVDGRLTGVLKLNFVSGAGKSGKIFIPLTSENLKVVDFELSSLIIPSRANTTIVGRTAKQIYNDELAKVEKDLEDLAKRKKLLDGRKKNLKKWGGKIE